MDEELWKLCEAECFEFLKRNYANDNVNFVQNGASDSTVSDIQVFKKNVACFYIESKMKSAQCGQFVLIPNKDKTFEYSQRNKYECSAAASYIIGKMDDEFDKFSKAGTRGQDLGLDDTYYYSWIIDSYQNCKQVKYFIVEKDTGNANLNPDNFVIFPIEKLHKYMGVSATYREKKSGSSSPSASLFQEIQNSLDRAGKKHEAPFIKNGKAFIKIDANEKFQVTGEKYDYQFNPQGDGSFEIRKLSNTRNSNVIFSIWLKSDQKEDDLETFKRDLI